MNRILPIKINAMSAVWDAGIEKWGIFEWGLPSFQATIDTSYHQFDLGDAMGTDSMDMNREYNILAFSDAVIRTAYMSLNTSFSQGVHPLNGYYTPNYTPFSWDVSQPFTYPYLFNNYQKLAVDINAYNAAKDTKLIDVSVRNEVEVILDVPCEISIDVPKIADPGEEITTDLHLFIDEDASIVTLNVLSDITVDMTVFYWTHSWDTTLDQRITYNLGTGEFSVIGVAIETDLNELESYSWNNVNLTNYTTLDTTLTPTLLGDIMDVNVSLAIADIIRDQLAPNKRWIVDLVADSLDYKFNPKIIGELRFDLWFGTTELQGDLGIVALNSTFPITFTFPSNTDSNPTLRLESIHYGVEFSVDWWLTLDWASLPGAFFDNIEWRLATWPEVDVDIVEGTSSINKLAEYDYNTKDSQWLLIWGIGEYGDTVPPRGISSLPFFAVGLSICSVVLLIRRQKKRIV